MKFAELDLELQNKESEVRINDELNLTVLDYLPVDEKGKFIEYVAVNALDNTTGCFSPLRVELYFVLAICHFYAGIEFDEVEPSIAYDLLETNGIVSDIIKAIPQDEISFLEELVEETIQDIARYNSSAAGIIQGMNSNASSLDNELTDIFTKLQSSEGLELLKDIKNGISGDTSKKSIMVKKG